MGLEEDFNTAAEEVKQLPSCSNEDKLLLYGLFKQAKEGDCNTSKPGMLDFSGKAKWEAWNNVKGMSQDDAKSAYIKLVSDLKSKYA